MSFNNHLKKISVVHTDRPDHTYLKFISVGLRRSFEQTGIMNLCSKMGCGTLIIIKVKWRMAIRKVPPKKGVALLLSN
jgi:hypothetical protein